MKSAEAEAQALQLELLSALPARALHTTPLLFVHGAYSGAWQWQDHFLPWFAEQGWAAYALSLSGHGASPGRERLDTLSIDDYVSDLRAVVASMPVRPVLIGHSMGGMVVQKFLEHESAPAAVLMASVPPRGLLQASLGLFFSKPGLIFDLNKIMGGGVPHLDSIREALFHGPVSTEILQSVFARSQPESMRAIWDMSMFNLPRTARMHRPPMLVMGAAEDHLIPATEVEHTAEVYDLTPMIFPNMGHGMMLEENWRAPAQAINDWLIAQSL